eukprot:scaffold26902_cov101-Isochrysis_galbana.AAC.1
MSFDWLNDGDEGVGADGSAAGSTAHGPVTATPGKPYAGQCFSSFEAAQQFLLAVYSDTTRQMVLFRGNRQQTSL